ncbi:transmembrane and coiled-coil domain-containing protein 2-like [Rhinatrema bivittatum]|uniref:transmembrane and coiled-coil domain-containing protein 2-like n=1 Tax=Rhinatrema bivittatum TaxID=194408 RepID=UPI00112AD74F|nr:transmembrane and coiled-coil domain-containing protein 2-like [Rhinatrema bivittatum]
MFASLAFLWGGASDYPLLSSPCSRIRTIEDGADKTHDTPALEASTFAVGYFLILAFLIPLLGLAARIVWKHRIYLHFKEALRVCKAAHRRSAGLIRAWLHSRKAEKIKPLTRAEKNASRVHVLQEKVLKKLQTVEVKVKELEGLITAYTAYRGPQSSPVSSYCTCSSRTASSADF